MKKLSKKTKSKRLKKSKKISTKKIRRSITKYPALRPELNLKTRFDLIEMDQKYWSDLMKDPVAAAFLNQFNEEFVNASFNKHKNPLHKTDESRKECYKRNNARNRCIYTREKAQGKLDYNEDLKDDTKEQFIEYETALIRMLDQEHIPVKKPAKSVTSKKTENLNGSSNYSKRRAKYRNNLK